MNNMILIGMPGCGKSTIGVVLAKVMGYRFIDSDLLIQEIEKRKLSEILIEEGPDRFNEIENRINASIKAEKTIIATGGSVVYGKEAMEHLRSIGTVIYLRLPLEEIENRLGELLERGISMREGQTLKDLYEERGPLYEKYAHLIIDIHQQDIRETMNLVREEYEKYIKRSMYW
jgi:shikimate kinase